MALCLRFRISGFKTFGIQIAAQRLFRATLGSMGCQQRPGGGGSEALPKLTTQFEADSRDDSGSKEGALACSMPRFEHVSSGFAFTQFAPGLWPDRESPCQVARPRYTLSKFVSCAVRLGLGVFEDLT